MRGAAYAQDRLNSLGSADLHVMHSEGRSYIKLTGSSTTADSEGQQVCNHSNTGSERLNPGWQHNRGLFWRPAEHLGVCKRQEHKAGAPSASKTGSDCTNQLVHASLSPVKIGYICGVCKHQEHGAGVTVATLK